MAKNYYLILGITPNSTLKQIRSAYLRRAKQLHPDHFGPDAQPFMDIQEAYRVLSHPRRKKEYDDRLQEGRIFGYPGAGDPEMLSFKKWPPRHGPAESIGPEEGPVDLGAASLTRSFQTFRPTLDEIFDRLWSNFSRLSRPKSEMLESLNLEVTVTPEEAQRGGHIRIHVPAQALCPTCGGQGGVESYECWRCAGEGAITGEFPVMVAFPPNLANNCVTQIPLDRFGIRNFFLSLHFRVSEGR